MALAARVVVWRDHIDLLGACRRLLSGHGTGGWREERIELRGPGSMVRKSVGGAAMTLKTVLRAVRGALAWRHWTWRRVGWACVWLAGAGVLAVVAAGAEIRLAAKGRTYSTVEEIPHRRVGLVLGCSRTLPDGRRNLYFITRMNAAAGLFKAGKVDYLIVSGDNHVRGYDEPTDMKQALADAGVPTNGVYCDYAGFRTLDSVVRAKEVFGQAHVTVISQQFHNERAIYIAGRRGVDAIGYNAEDVRSIHRLRTMFREQLARVKTVLDVSLLRTRPKFLGPRVEVGLWPQVSHREPSRMSTSGDNNE
jgi:SanA protein